MQEKIVMVVSVFHPMQVTKENIYDSLIDKYGREIKMTTFLTEFYRLLREGVIYKGDDGLYGLGANRTKRFVWYDAREPKDEL